MQYKFSVAPLFLPPKTKLSCPSKYNSHRSLGNMMHSTMVLGFANLVLFLAGVAAKNPPKPKLEYIYTARISGGPIYDIGSGPYGDRQVQAITNGTVDGPKFSGE